MTSIEEKFVFKQKVDIRWGDMDALRHVNNAMYMTYLEQGRIDYLSEVCGWDWTKNQGLILAKATLSFLSPLFYGDHPDLYIRCSRIGNKSFELAYRMVKEKDTNVLEANTVLVVYDYQLNCSVPIPENIKSKLKKA